MTGLIDRGITVGSKLAEIFMDKGDIKYLILNAITEKPMHGYQIISKISESFLNLYIPSPGTIYPALQLLGEQKMIKGKGRKGVKIYEITDKGKKYLETNKEAVSKIMEAIKENKELPGLKKIAGDFQELTKETLRLAEKSIKEKKEKTESNMQETRKIISEAIKKIRETWK